MTQVPENLTVPLPQPSVRGVVSVEEALSRRRSVREYAPGPLRLAEVGQLLWAAQGVTSESGGRTAPSARATHPLEVLLVAGEVEGLAPGVYRFGPQGHRLRSLRAGDAREALAMAARGQEAVRAGAITLVITAVYDRLTSKLGDWGAKFAGVEAGHAAQGLCLQATALGLGTVTMGAFSEDAVRKVLGLSPAETPLYAIPVGRMRS